MKILSLSMALALTLAASNVTAAGSYLVTDGTIDGIANTSNNQASFAVRVSGGSNNLCDGTYIVFPEADSPNKESHARAYATALTALTAGLPVRVYSYIDSSCGRAAYIEIRL